MARDYKDRGMNDRRQTRRDVGRRGNLGNKEQSQTRWILIAILVATFAAILAYIKFKSPEGAKVVEAPAELIKKESSPAKEDSKDSKGAKPAKPAERTEPKFDYYTILPEAEVVVPEHEIKTRMREELVGKVKSTQYILQAGSFRDLKDADKLKAELALMGIVSKIEKAKVGDVIWSRVKLGPYAQLASVETLKARLRKSGIDVIITEVAKQ